MLWLHCMSVVMLGQTQQTTGPGPVPSMPAVDQAQMQQLEAMGFPHWRVVRGLLATKGSGEYLYTMVPRHAVPVQCNGSSLPASNVQWPMVRVRVRVRRCVRLRVSVRMPEMWQIGAATVPCSMIEGHVHGCQVWMRQCNGCWSTRGMRAWTSPLQPSSQALGVQLATSQQHQQASLAFCAGKSSEQPPLTSA